jgi:uncharacterized protein YukE
MDDFGGTPSPFADINGMGVDYKEQNKGITPIFFMEPVKDEAASEREGIARFTELERVRIVVAGDQFNIAVHPVDAGIRERFSDQYERWKKNREVQTIDGTPIEQWAILSRAQIMELKAMGIHSIENASALSDANLQRIPDGRAMRAKAQAYLEAAKDGAAAMRFAAENERLKDDVAELRKTIEELSAKVSEERRGPVVLPR